MGVTKMAAVLLLAFLGCVSAQQTTGANTLQQALNIDPNAPGVPSKVQSISVPVIDVGAAVAAAASVDTDPAPEAATAPEVPTEAEAAVAGTWQAPATPDDSPTAEPTPPRRRNRRAGSDPSDPSASAQFLAPRPPTTPPRPPPPPPRPTPVTSVTCKIDASGNVADVIVHRSRNAASTGCTPGGASATLKGGYNVVLDFSDSGIVQVVQGKLSAAANAPVAWLGFRTDSADMRTCGNARPSSANAVISKWGTIYDRDLETPAAEAAYSRMALYTVVPTCAGTSTSRRMSGLNPTAMSGAFVAPLPDLQPLVPGMPAACTSLLTWPFPVNVPAKDEGVCVGWLGTQKENSSPSPLSFPANPVCPAVASPNQWSYAITKAQLPASRPSGFTYRRLSTAKTNITVETLQPEAPPRVCVEPEILDKDDKCCTLDLLQSDGFCCLPPNVLQRDFNAELNETIEYCYPPTDGAVAAAAVQVQHNAAAAAAALSQAPLPSWIVAKVEHAPIPSVNSAMMYWWFNGNIDGDMLWNGKRYPRYLLWHPRDHVSQDTIIPGPTPGTAEGAYWSIIEFLMAPGSGYTRSSRDGSWRKTYMGHVNLKVQRLTRNRSGGSVELAVLGLTDEPIMKILHEWSDTTVGSGRFVKPALALTSTLNLGRPLAPGATPGLNGPQNGVAWKVFGGDCPREAANAWVQHTVEEMGNLEHFLPKLYWDNTGTMG